MKNKGMLIVIISSIIVVIASIIYVSSLKNIDNNLLNHKWYHYNKNSGYSDILFIDSEKMDYYKPINDNQTDDYSFCNGYKYNKSTKELLLDCGKKIKINSIDSSKLELTIDELDLTFFKDIKSSVEYEFEKYYGKKISEYKNSNKQTLEIIKIDTNKISNILNDKDYSKIIFIGDKCSSIECSLTYDIVEKWISFSKNIYYVDSSTLNNNTLSQLNNISDSFSLNINEYNDVYPIVYVVSNKKVIDKYKIMCEGFNCSNYYNK